MLNLFQLVDCRLQLVDCCNNMQAVTHAQCISWNKHDLSIK